jgi:hypothetical protein
MAYAEKKAGPWIDPVWRAQLFIKRKTAPVDAGKSALAA